MMNLGRFKGTVIEYRGSKAFGFIKITHEIKNENTTLVRQRYDEVFVYHKDIIPPKGTTFQKLIQGQIVEFDAIRNDKGLKALNLSIVMSRV